MEHLPKISIVIPSYKKTEYIAKPLQSIIPQKYPRLEVIIQDGGSTDATVAAIGKYAKRYPKIIRWESKRDNGQTDAINKGLKKATGEVLAYLNADDIYCEGALKRVGEYFVKHPQTLWLAGRGKVIDSKGKTISSWVSEYKNFLLSKNRYWVLLMVNYLMQPSVFLSRRASDKYAPFSGTKTSVMEYDLWLKLGRVQMPKRVNKCLSGFRMSGDNISSTAFRETLRADDKIGEKYTDNPVILALHYLHNIARTLLVYSN